MLVKNQQITGVSPEWDTADTWYLVEMCAHGGQVSRTALEMFESGRRYLEFVESATEDTMASGTRTQAAADFDAGSILWWIADDLGIDGEVETITQGADCPEMIADAIISWL